MRKCGFLGILLISLSYAEAAWHADFGPWVVSTQGEPWPMVERREFHDGFLLLRLSTFNIIVDENCYILTEAKTRYMSIILTEAHYASSSSQNQRRPNVRQDSGFRGELGSLTVHVGSSCEHYPYLNMNESYTLIINGNASELYASTTWGALRGLETFSQLLVPSGERSNLKIQMQTINDQPILRHRGLLLDTSRHFLPLSDIFLTLDAMAYNKLNVFHWHMVDDNSFPYQSTRFPELSQKGAWHPKMIYTSDDIKNVIEYARLRGIRVVPEFDTPGHTRSWGESHPELLTQCYDSLGQPTNELGPINPSEAKVWSFLSLFFHEVMTLFLDNYVHLGGDEVPFDCWKSNPNITAYMQEQGWGEDYTKLQNAFTAELLRISVPYNKHSIVWQEVFDNGVTLQPDTAVHIWTGFWARELTRATEAHHPVLLSACWYLDHVASGGDWEKFYTCDPLNFDGYEANKELMLGGEACMWGEFVNRYNVHSRIWPRASATAERLWSKSVGTLDNAAQRLEEHTCRMNKRKVPAQPPNGPSACYV